MRTDTVIKNEGMNALIDTLGYVDAEKFIMLINKEPFDYTEWRNKHLDNSPDVRALSQQAMRLTKTKQS